MTSKSIITRFAPSPTGFLHKGHAYSAMLAHDFARLQGGRFIVRIEDIDQSRCRPGYSKAIETDLDWLGLDYERPVRRQSDHFADYDQILQQLTHMGLTYPCFCTRKDQSNNAAKNASPTAGSPIAWTAPDMEGAASAPHGLEPELLGHLPPVYSGRCKALSAGEIAHKKSTNLSFATRLDCQKAVAFLGSKKLIWQDSRRGKQALLPFLLGDIVLARKDCPTSYHLAVVADDALQGISHIIRGEDLFLATHIQVLLQALLGYPHPFYDHHPLLRDQDGKRYAKRDQALSLKALREAGTTAAMLRAEFGLPLPSIFP